MQTNLLNRYFTTAMRGVAILLIIISHAGNDGFRLKFLIPLGAIGVAIFLVLSGYGLMESYNKSGLSNFWSKRFLRLLLPYMAWVCLYSSFMLLLKKDFSIDSIRYWFVEYIVLWYVVFYVTLKCAKKNKWPVFIFIAIVFFLLMGNLQAQQSLSFLVGIALSDKKELVEKIPQKSLILIGFACLFFAVVSFGMKHWFFLGNVNGVDDIFVIRNIGADDYVTKLLQLLPKVPFALSSLILLKFMLIERTRLFYIIGLASYELYLVFFPFRVTIDGDMGNLIIFVFAVVYLGYLLYIFNKRATIVFSDFIKRIPFSY